MPSFEDMNLFFEISMIWLESNLNLPKI